MDGKNTIRVLIVDDSAIVRKILSESLAAEPDIEVVGTAPDPFVAANKIAALQPHVLTLDIEMPGMDGLTFLKKLMKHKPMPVIIVSSLAQRSCAAALEAMRLGAIDVVAKPGGPFSVGDLKSSLATKVRAAAGARVMPDASALKPPPSPSSAFTTAATAPAAAPPAAIISPASPFDSSRLIAIGASTGGTEAIRVVLEQMPANSPGIVVTQHIPAGFSTAFADRLGRICKIRVREAKDGDLVEPGLALVAPGDYHMTVRRLGAGYRVVVQTGPKVCYQRPSVDVLFNSVAEVAEDNAVAALLTGMGADGARGLLKILNHQGSTIAQDEASCVVFGMPREAIKLNAAQQILPLTAVAQALLNASVRGTAVRNSRPAMAAGN